MPHIVSIVYKPAQLEDQPPDWYSRQATDRAELVPGQGIVGDKMGDAGDRQLNIMRSETVDELKREGFRTQPGELGEQIVLSGVALDQWAPGARLRLGDVAVVELVKSRTGCPRFAHIQDRPVKLTTGRLGFMARVVNGGEIAVGSPVSIQAT